MVAKVSVWFVLQAPDMVILPVSIALAARAPRFWRDVLPLLVPLTLLPWFCVTWGNYTDTFLFRDPAMFQYAAWCMRKGERIYDSIATPDGPLIYIIHAALQLFTRTSEQAFRAADLIFHLIVAFGTGALLSPRGALVRWVAPVVWGLFHSSVWLAFLFSFDFGGSVQREQYYVLLGMAGLTLVYRCIDRSARTATIMLLAGGFITALQMFGKHSGVLYPILGLAILLLQRANPEYPRTRRLRSFGMGVLSAIIILLLFIAVFGSLSGFWFWYFRYAFTMYQHWFAIQLSEVLVARSEFGLIAVTVLVGGGAAVGVGLFRRDALPFAIAPSLQFALAVVQAKGWSYQFSIVVGSAIVFFTIALAAVWDEPRASTRWSAARRLSAVGLLFFVGTRAFEMVQKSYWLTDDKRLKALPEINDPRRTAEILRSKTRPDDRLFFYGRDIILGFLAQRLPATPYEVAWLLNYRGALEPGAGYKQATSQQRAKIVALQTVVQADACRRVRASHPAAMVFMDGLPEAGPDGLQEVARFCPEVPGMLEQEYHLAAHNGAVRLYLRNDRM